jgi:hypothetical protein
MSFLKLLSGLLPQFVKDVADGKHGEPAKSFYWALAGKKTVIALVIAALYGMAQVSVNVLGQCVPECGSAESLAQIEGILAYVPNIVTFLVAVGIFDAAVRIEPPKKS